MEAADHSLPQPVFVPNAKVLLEMCEWSIHAGFPSPAADHTQKRIDLNDHLIRNKEATFIFKVKAHLMLDTTELEEGSVSLRFAKSKVIWAYL